MIVINTHNAFCKILEIFTNTFEILAKVSQNLISLFSFRGTDTCEKQGAKGTAKLWMTAEHVHR